MVQQAESIFLADGLSKRNAVYEGLVKLVEAQSKKGNPEKTLTLIRFTAQFAVSFHTGRYADGSIENIALEIGRNLDQFNLQKMSSQASFDPSINNSLGKQILHVATTIYATGGHTRLIENWIKNHPGVKHSLLLTEQGDTEVPVFIKEVIQNTGGNLIQLPRQAFLIERSKMLREVARSEASFVILHHHPDDVIPIVALASERCPPVAVMNHADHLFWLGTSIADLVINVRSFAAALSGRRRFARRNLLLPIPLSPPDPRLTRDDARRQLGIKDEDIMLLSVGSAYKYKPSGTHNFFKTIGKVLDANPSACIYLIGPELDDCSQYLGETGHDRMHFLGLQENTYIYKLAADLYVEGFPIASFTALLEAAAMGVCPVLMYAPIPELRVSEHVGVRDIIDNVETEEEYVHRASRLIQDPDERLRVGKLIKDQVIAYHTGDKWREFLSNIVSCLENSGHNPEPIPRSACTQAQEDLNLTELKLTKLGKNPVLLEMCWHNFSKFDSNDVINLFLLSLKTRDTKWFSRQSVVWIATIKSKALGSMLDFFRGKFDMRLRSLQF